MKPDGLYVIAPPLRQLKQKNHTLGGVGVALRHSLAVELTAQAIGYGHYPLMQNQYASTAH